MFNCLQIPPQKPTCKGIYETAQTGVGLLCHVSRCASLFYDVSSSPRVNRSATARVGAEHKVIVLSTWRRYSVSSSRRAASRAVITVDQRREDVVTLCEHLIVDWKRWAGVWTGI